MAVYGYARVSTKGQLKDGYSLEQQEQEIRAKYDGVKVEVIKEQFTGTTTNRPKLQWLLGKLKENDILVVGKLDRLARTTSEGIEIVRELFKKGVSIHVLNVGLLENTTMGNFFITTLLAVAEMECSLIVERTQAGKMMARQNPDFRDGRPKKFKRKQIEHALELLETHTYKQVEDKLGISKSTLIRAKRERKAKENASESEIKDV